MDKLSYRRHRFPGIVIQQAVWLYFRFALSYRDVEDMLAERGIDVSYETVRRWALKFGSIIARKVRRGRPRPDGGSRECVVGLEGLERSEQTVMSDFRGPRGKRIFPVYQKYLFPWAL
jgi:hypothetical protein